MRVMSRIQVRLQVAGCHFHCMVGVVAQLDCPMFLGWDCPVLVQILRAIQQVWFKGK